MCRSDRGDQMFADHVLTRSIPDGVCRVDEPRRSAAPMRGSYPLIRQLAKRRPSVSGENALIWLTAVLLQQVRRITGCIGCEIRGRQQFAERMTDDATCGFGPWYAFGTPLARRKWNACDLAFRPESIKSVRRERKLYWPSRPTAASPIKN